MPDERQKRASGRPSWRQGCALLAGGCVLALMAGVLGGALVLWRGGTLPELNTQVGTYHIVAYTTVVPTCSPTIPCRQQFADVPLPRYYVIWIIPQNTTHDQGTRMLTLPLTLPRLR